MTSKKTAPKKPVPPNPMFKKKLSHNSLYFKKEFEVMYVPVPMRTAITFRLFWWNKWSINIRAGWKMLKLTLTKSQKKDDTKTNDKA